MKYIMNHEGEQFQDNQSPFFQNKPWRARSERLTFFPAVSYKSFAVMKITRRVALIKIKRNIAHTPTD